MSFRGFFKERKEIFSVIDIILCAILALMFTVSPSYIGNGECDFTWGLFFTSIVYFLIFSVGAFFLRQVISQKTMPVKQDSKVLQKLEEILNSKHSVLKIGGFIFVAWLPVLCFLYPGTLINDTWRELGNFIAYASSILPLNDHDPIFDTLVMGLAIVPLAKATGNWHLAIFIYMIVNAMCSSLAFSYAINYVYKKLNLGVKISAFLILIYSFLQLYPASVQTVGKDSLSAWIFVIFFCEFMEIVRTNGASCEGKGPTRLIISGIFVCLTKKVGVYVVVLSVLALVIILKGARKEVATVLFTFILAGFVLMPISKTMMHVKPGGKQEMLSLPFQMTARYVRDFGGDITEDEYEIIDTVLTIDNLAERYNATNADPVKDAYQKGDTSDYIDYILVWMKQGFRHPKAYWESTIAMLSGWFSWTENDPLLDMAGHNNLDSTLIPEWVPDRTFSLNSATEYAVFYHRLYENALLRLLISYGLYAALIPAFVLGTVSKKIKSGKLKYYAVIIPTLLSLILGCWLAPLSWLIEGRRYLYPVTYTVPLLVVWCRYMYMNEKDK